MLTLNGKCNGFNFHNFFTPITSKKQNKMKKIFSRIMIVVGIVATTSCADEFLDQTSPSEMTDKTVWNSTYYTSLRINKLYAGMVDGDRTYDQDITIKWGLNSDVELVDGLGSNATNSTHYRGVGNYNASPLFLTSATHGTTCTPSSKTQTLTSREYAAAAYSAPATLPL